MAQTRSLAPTHFDGSTFLTLARHCRERGVTWIGLVAEPGTTAFYERLGFRPLAGHVAMRLSTPELP